MNYLIFSAKLLCLIQIFIIHTTTTRQERSLISRIYKKAAEQKKPLVLVLDTANYETAAEATRLNKHTRLQSSPNSSIEPFLYLYQLGQKSYPFSERNTQSGRGKYEHPKSKSWIRDWSKKELTNRFHGDIQHKRERSYQNQDRINHEDDLENQAHAYPDFNSLLRIPDIGREGDSSCSDTSAEKESGKERKICDEYVKKASECRGVDFDTLLHKKKKGHVKLPSTMASDLIHEIDWN